MMGTDEIIFKVDHSDEAKYHDCIEMWLDYFRDDAFEMTKGKSAEERLEEWCEQMDFMMRELKSPIVPVDAPTQQIRLCWEECLRADFERISREGWWVRLDVPSQKNPDWRACVCEFLPPSAVVDESYTNERRRIDLLREQFERTGSVEDLQRLNDENAKLIQELIFQYATMNPGLIAHYTIENKWAPILYGHLSSLVKNARP